MVTLRVILKSGQDFYVKCKEYGISKTADGIVIGYELEGVIENDPVCLDFSQIAAIVRVLSDEPSCVVCGLDEAASAAG